MQFTDAVTVAGNFRRGNSDPALSAEARHDTRGRDERADQDRAERKGCAEMTPTPSEVREARKRIRLTQAAAGEIVHSSAQTWKQWEMGVRKMHPGLWELFRLKTAEMR